MRRITPLRRGSSISSAEENAKTRELARQGNVTFDGGTVDSSAAGIHLAPNPERPKFYARLTSKTGQQYGWEEVTPVEDDATATLSWSTLSGGRTGSTGSGGSYPAYELNAQTVELQRIALLELSREGDYYVFYASGCLQ